MQSNFHVLFSCCFVIFFTQIICERTDEDSTDDEWIGQVDISFIPKAPQENGEFCKFNPDCQSNCCLRERVSGRRTCASKSQLNERCTTGQIKGGFYDSYCPCAEDKGNCNFGRSKSRYGICL